jgi:hypothetical protein
MSQALLAIGKPPKPPGFLVVCRQVVCEKSLRRSRFFHYFITQTTQTTKI